VLSPIGAAATTSAFWLRRVAGRTGCRAAGAPDRRIGPPVGTRRPLVAGTPANAEKARPLPFRVLSAPGGRPGPSDGRWTTGMIHGEPDGPAVVTRGDAADEDSTTGPARARPDAASKPGSASATGAATSTSASHPESRHSTVRVPMPAATAAARSHAGPSPRTATWAAASAARSAAASARWRASTADPMCRPTTSTATSTATAPVAQTVARPSSRSRGGFMAGPRPVPGPAPRPVRRRPPHGRRSGVATATGARRIPRPRRCHRRG